MKNIQYIQYFFFAILFVFNACQETKVEENETTIKVGVFGQNGASPINITDAVEALKIDKDISPRVISVIDILSGAADDIDVFLFPGGSGRFQTGNLGEQGQQKINSLIKTKGKGAIGICAGAYALTETPDYPGLALSGAEAIDIEHDNRGHGLVKFSLTEEGKKIFPELKDSEVSFSQYYEGPVLIPAKESKYKYIELATMLSDVHTVEGAPAGMTVNRPFIIITNVEKGKTASIVGHPESTPGMRWIVPRLVRYVADKELISYSDKVVRPELHTKEVLFTEELLEKRYKLYLDLFKSKDEKIKAMQELVDMKARPVIRHDLIPMLRNKNFEIRLKAAELIVYLERTEGIDDLNLTISLEQNSENKKKLEEQLVLLESLLGK
ncbi:biofilm PGA synthesis protein PgaB [Bacteroidota bacterium]